MHANFTRTVAKKKYFSGPYYLKANIGVLHNFFKLIFDV